MNRNRAVFEEVALAVKKMPRVGSDSRVSLRKDIEKGNHQGKVVCAFGIVLCFLGVKEEVAGEHFKKHAGERPHVCCLVVVDPENYFWRAVLPGLNFWLEVVMLPAAVSEICDFYREVLT